MRILIKEKLSEHKSETPEGYLICQDAILARTGDQAYLKSEIYEDFDGEDMMVNVQRKPEQVFSSEALASFEDKPITVEHPDESVGPHNYSELAVGHTRNVRKGKFNGQDVMIADLVITDEQAIEDIKNGIRTELSCGYDCDITKGDHPEQINIRGNHVALCEEGRAGIAKIIDSKSAIKDVNPKEGESKRAFIARFMSETKGEYPDRKQRYAVANSYWDKKDEKKVEDKIPALDRKIKNQISKYLHSISTFTKKDTDISEILDPIHDMGYDTIVESINGWNKTDSGIYRKDYFCRIKGYPDVFMVSLYADPNKDWAVDEINAYFTGEKATDIEEKVDAEDIKIEDTEDIKIEDDPTNKYVIYKMGNTFYVTSYKNYYARISNARAVYPIRDAESAEEVIDMLINNGWVDSREDVIVIGNDPIVDKANVTDDYPKKFYEKYLNLLKKKEKKLSKENEKVSDENEIEEKLQKFNIYKEIKKQIKECEESLDE